MMSETNGRSESRLDRIEAILERHSTMMISIEASIDRQNLAIDRQILANEAAHARFEEEDKRLLTSQILMNAALQKMADGMISLELKMEETTGKLNALIHSVDDMIRGKG